MNEHTSTKKMKLQSQKKIQNRWKYSESEEEQMRAVVNNFELERNFLNKTEGQALDTTYGAPR